MQTPLRNRAAPALRPPTAQTAVALLLLAAFFLVVLLGALGAARRIGDLRDRRDLVLATRSDPAAVAGEAAGAFRRFRSGIHPGERFALVFAPAVGRDQRGFYRLVALSYLYPAIAVSDLASADAVMVFGAQEPSPAVRTAFDETDVVDGVWLGRRRR